MTGPAPSPCDAGVIAATPPLPCVHSTGVLAATVLGSSLAFIDGSVVNVALPTMQNDLGIAAAGAQWVVNTYLLLLSALVLLGGAASDHFGRRRIFSFGVVLFTIASLAAALAPDAGLLIAARSIQGMAQRSLFPAASRSSVLPFRTKNAAGRSASGPQPARSPVLRVRSSAASLSTT